MTIFGNAERARTAKGLGNNEDQLRRTRLLMDKITGKNNIEMKYSSRPETGGLKKIPVVSEKMIKVVPQTEQ